MEQHTSPAPQGQGRSCGPDAAREFEAFVDTIASLRAPEGCPWDREQTHASISRNMIEEAFEAVDAIEQNDMAHLREELGDVLLQVVLQSQIAADEGDFTVADVCRDVNAKMIRRHPHVFGEAEANSAGEVLDLWDSVKLKERAGAERPEGLLDSVPVSLPALLQAYKISRKATAVGFEWQTVEDVWDKVDEEIAEFKQACAANDPDEKMMEFGDVLFSLVNVARKEGVDPEAALRATCRKFRDRWSFMEQASTERGLSLEDAGMDEMQALWDEAKRSCAEGDDDA